MSVTIEQARSVGDYAPLMKWNMSFVTTPAGVTVPADFNFRVLSTDVPKKEAGQTSAVWIRGSRIKQPGVYTSSDSIVVTIAETVDNAASLLTKQWSDLCWNLADSVQGERLAVQARIRIERLNRQNVPIWFYELRGAFLEDYDPLGGQLDGENSDIMRPTMTLAYDYFEDGPV